MTEKQKQYIALLDETLIDFSRYGEPKKLSKDILGKNWLEEYPKISYKDTQKCISVLQEEAIKLGCYESDWYINSEYY